MVVGQGVIDEAASHLPAFPKAESVFVVADREVADRWFDRLAAGLADRGWSCTMLTVPAGEEAKSLDVYRVLLHQLATQEAHRDDVVVALGGGSVGDLSGFVASTYMRGMPFVQVPTTLTAQVDAAIGGKTAVNLPEGKNLVGTFTQPRAVLADVSTPRHAARPGVPLRRRRGGEVRAHARPGAARPNWRPILLRCWHGNRRPWSPRRPVRARRRRSTVSDDERDTGARLILNYGHTLGHALERLDAFEGRTHGEAVASGMVFAARSGGDVAASHGGARLAHGRLLVVAWDWRPTARCRRSTTSWRRSDWTRSTTVVSASCCCVTWVTRGRRRRPRGAGA